MRRLPLTVSGTTNINKMDVTSSVESLSHKTIKQKFMRWASKWYYADIVDENPDKPDVTLLICLLQSIGFQLRQFEKSNDAINIKSNDNNNNSVKVTIECGVSKMKAILELDNVKCQCPNSQDASYASFWSVSGTAPTGSMDCINKFEETGSNLLPRLSKDTHRVIHDILHSLLNIIKNKIDVDHNTDDNVSVSTYEKIGKDYYDTYKTFESPEAFARCYTQPEIPSYIQRHTRHNNNLGSTETLNRNLSNMNIRSTLSCKNIPSIITTSPPPPSPQNPTPLLIRQKTWDMETKSVENEPRSSPLRISNSPVMTTELCPSLGRVSLQSDDGSLTLMECLKRARFYIEKAQNLQGLKRSPSTPGSVSANAYKGSDSFSKLTTRSKTTSRPNLQIRSTLSSAARIKSPSGAEVSQITGQKIMARRSVSGIGGFSGRISIDSPKTPTTPRTTTTMPTNLPIRRQTVGEPSQSLKLSVAGAKRKFEAAKIKSHSSISSASTTSNSSTLSTASHSRVIMSTRRRISPEIRSSLANTISSGDFSQVKLSGTTRTPNNGGSSTIGMTTPKSIASSRIKLSGINSGLKKPISNLPKYGLSKK